MEQAKYAAGRALRWIMSRREPILATLIHIDLGIVRYLKVKVSHAVRYFKTNSKKTQELDAKFMTKNPKIV